MWKILIASVSLGALTAAGAAHAADLPRRQVAPPPAGIPSAGFSWTGFYIGSHTGVAVGRTVTGNTAPYGGFDSGTALNYELNPTMIFGGGQIGYNWQAGVFVLGVEGDLGYLGLRSEVHPGPDNFVSVRYGWYGTVTGRLGLATDRLLSYVKGGAVVARITNRASDFDGGLVDPSDFSETSRTRWGWTAGTGFEVAVAPQWSLKSEYMFMNFGRVRGTNLDGDTFEHKNEVHTFRIGLNYRFGGNSPIFARY